MIIFVSLLDDDQYLGTSPPEAAVAVGFEAVASAPPPDL